MNRLSVQLVAMALSLTAKDCLAEEIIGCRAHHLSKPQRSLQQATITPSTSEVRPVSSTEILVEICILTG
jgi:hypothetical protein